MVHHARKTAAGFTLIELLIVIILLGVMAGITIPQFADTTPGAKTSALATTVHTVRSQVAMYKLQHGDQLPDLAAASAAGDHFRPLLEQSTFGSPPQTYGPYLLSAPVNAITGGSTVLNAGSFDAAGQPEPVAGADFIYDYAGGNGTGNVWGTSDRASGTPLP